MNIDAFPDRLIYVDGKEFLYFGGTAYLGLPTNKDFQKKVFKGIEKWGTFYGSSRNANVKLSIYEEAEVFFAKHLKSEAALSVSSGTLAGRLVVEYLEQDKYKFYHYPKTHPAILSKQSEPLFKERHLHSQLLNEIEETVVITCDAILSGEVEPTNFDFIKDIHTNKTIILIVDESHTLGILDKTISESLEKSIKDRINQIIIIASLGKALGISGGIIGSDYEFISAIKQQPLFVSSSCPNAAHLYALLHSQKIIELQRQKLLENVQFLETILAANPKLKFKPPYPVMYSEDNDLANRLLKDGIVIANFKYPNYNHLMNRIVITANHTLHDLEKLVDLFDY